jgi:hypothetical protein
MLSAAIAGTHHSLKSWEGVMQNIAIDKLRQSLRGTFIERSDPNYDEGRSRRAEWS